MYVQLKASHASSQATCPPRPPLPLAGAGAFEVAAAHHLRTVVKKTVQGRAKLGIEAFAEALMGFPKILAENSGYDPQEVIIKLQVRQGRACV